MEALCHLSIPLTFTIIHGQALYPRRPAPRDSLLYVVQQLFLKSFCWDIFVRGQKQSEVGGNLFPFDR